MSEMEFEGKCCLLTSRTVVDARIVELPPRIVILGAGAYGESWLRKMFMEEQKWEVLSVGPDWAEARRISETTALSFQEVIESFKKASQGLRRSAQMKGNSMFSFRPSYCRSINLEVQNKLNKLNGELSRAKMRKDKHLIKQIEAKIRNLTTEAY